MDHGPKQNNFPSVGLSVICLGGSRELAAEIAQSILTSGRILPQSLHFCYFFGGVKPVTFFPRAREEWEPICSARNQEIYWRIAPLAYDDPIKTLRGSVKITGTQKPVRAITFAAPIFFYFFGSLDTLA